MTSRIKIVGVQFAANPDHEPETPMTAQENQRTIDLLTQLDRTRPRVTIKPEPTNAADKEALAVRLMSRKIGYVRNRDDYKSIAFAALAASGRGFFHARVVEVEVDEHGYFYVAVETDNLPLVPIVHDDKWMEWEPPLPLFPMTEEMLSVDDAVMMLQELLTLITLTAEDEEEVRGYTEALVSTGKNALWNEARMGMENIVRMMEAKDGEWIQKLAQDMEHLLSGLCTEHRKEERKHEWLPRLLASHDADRCWHEWLHLKGADCRELDLLELSLWLNEIETLLTNIPALANRPTADETDLLTRAYYTHIPLRHLRLLLAAFAVRHRLRIALGLTATAAAPILIGVMQQRLVKTIVAYCRQLKRLEDVKVMQSFLYRHIPYLPPSDKQLVDGMTGRFLSIQEGQMRQTEALQQQTEALKAVAEAPRINNHFAQGSVSVEAGGTMMGDVKIKTNNENQNE